MLQYHHNGKSIQPLVHCNVVCLHHSGIANLYCGFLTLGTQRAQLVHLTYLTWPRPCFDRPQFRLFCVCTQREQRSKPFNTILKRYEYQKHKTQDLHSWLTIRLTTRRHTGKRTQPLYTHHVRLHNVVRELCTHAQK